MQQRRFLAGSIVILLLAVAVQGQAASPAVTEVNLEKPLEAKGAVTLDASGGVVFQFGPVDPQGLPVRKLTVLDGQATVKQFADEAMYNSYARVESGQAGYWVIGLYTGGAHCCGEYEVFCRPGPGQPLRYLGKTPGHNGGPQDLRQAFVVKDNQLYFKEMDNRFDYFHESHAGCMLVNFPDRYHLLTPTSFTVANTAFKEKYLEELPAVDKEISQELKSRKRKLQAILDQGNNFSDALGQLLVKRALLLLYAREDARAWQTLEADVKKYYQTTRWLPELKKDIQELLASAPY
jgi:hypothetical protein